MDLPKLKYEAKELHKSQRFEEALPLFEKVWNLEETDWNAYFLARAYRKTGKYSDAEKMHELCEKSFPGFLPIKNEKLWLIYENKIKDLNNSNLIEDAEFIISNSSETDKFTGLVYQKTVLRVVRKLIYQKDFEIALQWLLKLSPRFLQYSTFNYQGSVFPSDRKTYFIHLADVLINLDIAIPHLENLLSGLGFQNMTHTKFKKEIIDQATFEDYISRKILGRHFFKLKSEYDIRLGNTSRITWFQKQGILVSDLSHYSFCPVSYSIAKSFIHPVDVSSWESDEWATKKLLLIDRYKIYSQTKDYNEAFKDTEILENSSLSDLRKDFDLIFKSRLAVNNATNPKPTIYSNKVGDLKGAPDYIFEKEDSSRFSVTEKFVHISSADTNEPYLTDKIKHIACFQELEKTEVQFGYFIRWYWEYVDDDTVDKGISKKIRITSYKLNIIENTTENNQKLKRVFADVKSLNEKGSMNIEGRNISWPSKCLSCSVSEYCHHKTGRFDLLKFPYELNDLKVVNEPIPELYNPSSGYQENSSDDLPF